MSDIRKVLMVSAKAGAGHIRASEAVVEALTRDYPDVNSRHIEMLEYMNGIFAGVYTNSYNWMAGKHPRLWRTVFEKSDAWKPHGFSQTFSQTLNRLCARRFIRMMRREKPDTVGTTHFLAAEILARMRRKGTLSARLNVVITDFDVHSMWVQDGVDHYLVASDDTASVLRGKGVPAEKITVTGIPIMSVFSAEFPDRQAMRRKLGLRQEPTTVLVSAGGYGLSRLDLTVAMLAKAAKDVQMIAIGGRNEKLKKDLEAVASKYPGRIVVTGFISNMQEYMAASDFTVAKSGGLTLSECTAMGLPMVIMDPIPGQEERNADFAMENGVALRANSPGQLVWKFKRMIEEPGLVERMRQSARKVGKPNAARDAARVIVGGA